MPLGKHNGLGGCFNTSIRVPPAGVGNTQEKKSLEKSVINNLVSTELQLVYDHYPFCTVLKATFVKTVTF